MNAVNCAWFQWRDRGIAEIGCSKRSEASPRLLCLRGFAPHPIRCYTLPRSWAKEDSGHVFNLINIELFPITVGAEVSGVVLTGEGASSEPYRDGRAVPTDLPVPWRTLQEDTDIFSMLQWRTAISEFAGRET